MPHVNIWQRGSYSRKGKMTHCLDPSLDLRRDRCKRGPLNFFSFFLNPCLKVFLLLCSRDLFRNHHSFTYFVPASLLASFSCSNIYLVSTVFQTPCEYDMCDNADSTRLKGWIAKVANDKIYWKAWWFRVHLQLNVQGILHEDVAFDLT